MPRKTIRRFLPDLKGILNRPSMRWISALPQDPNLLHLNRHSVSLAVFIGIFCAFIPIPIQTLLVIGLCFWWGANLPIAIVIIWLSNPLTIPPMFYLTYKLGSSILGTEVDSLSFTLSWEWFSQLGVDILLPLFVGSLLSGILLASAGYFFILFLWRWKVIRNWEKRKDLRNSQ
ncbi:MAG: DUF2062 domain-containing protein [Porticoccaceae bacterium]|jgi:uncharacterized protein (DUF2062 family)|nr:DUF2062 domain-containing protein [Porticoccaceae bacterium]|tara:strand:- start:7039 stop:7560 length:522 start_codon:yes stop_codon:yes gene_type:complete